MATVRRVTLRDIARQLGVSHATVSLALKNNPEISRQRREEVQSLARELGYRPDPALASLVAYRQGRGTSPVRSSVAWLNHWEHPADLRKRQEFDAYWRGAQESVESFGYHLDEIIWPQGISAARFEKILHTRNIRGILIPPHPQQPDWGNFHWDYFSAVRFGQSVKNPNCHVVTTDQFGMVMTAMTKIRDYGYTRIGAVVPYGFDVRLGGGYSGGYYAAQQMLQLNPRIPLLSDFNDRDLDYSRDRFESWFREHRPQAILSTTALPQYILRGMGLRIPEDVAVAGTSTFDLPFSAGINQNSFEIGRAAVDTLVSLINRNDVGRPSVPRRILVEGSWQDGDSLPDLRGG